MLGHNGLVLASLVLLDSGVGGLELLKMAELFYTRRIFPTQKPDKMFTVLLILESLNIFHFF